MLVFKHLNRLGFVPMMLGGQDTGPEHIQKSVHFGFHFIAELPDRMMQSGGEFNWDMMFSGRQQCSCDLDRVWKSIGRDASGPQFVTKRRLFRAREQSDRL